MKVAKTWHPRIRRNITLLSPSAPCLFVGAYTEEGLPKPLAPSLWLPITTVGITVVGFL